MKSRQRSLTFFSFSLIKEETNRPKYKTLLQHPFIQLHEKLQPYVHPEVAQYVGKSLRQLLKLKSSAVSLSTLS